MTCDINEGDVTYYINEDDVTCDIHGAEVMSRVM